MAKELLDRYGMDPLALAYRSLFAGVLGLAVRNCIGMMRRQVRGLISQRFRRRCLVRCSACGLLCNGIFHYEASQTDRTLALQNPDLPIPSLTCLDDLPGCTRNTLDQDRECPSFIPYKRGMSPAEHRASRATQRLAARQIWTTVGVGLFGTLLTIGAALGAPFLAAQCT